MPKPYLYTRNACTFVRFFVPTDLQASLGQRYMVRSMGVLPHHASTFIAHALACALHSGFTQLRGGEAVDFDDLIKKAQAGALRHYGITLPNGIKLETDGTEADHRRAMEAIETIGRIQLVSAPSPAPTTPATPMLSACIAMHLQDMELARRASGNVLDTKFSLRLFLETVGDLPVGQVLPAHIRAFADLVERWPSNASKNPKLQGLTAPEIVKKADKLGLEKIAPRTANKHRDRIAVFFNALVNQGVLPKAPHQNLPRPKPTGTTKQAFTRDEIRTLFLPDNFDPWAEKYAHRRWGSLLGLFLGARLGEVAQLYCDDVQEVQGLLCVQFRALRPDQRLKNQSSQRIVPLPQLLIDCGFGAFIEGQRKAKHERLFPDLPHHQRNGYGDALGDQFSRYAKGLGIGKTFHSFRHSVFDALTYSDHVAVRNQITGHSEGGMESVYKHPTTLHAMKKALDSLCWPVLPTPFGS